jgi:cbb3-type cytochrome oxidase maturation protein
MSVLYLVLPLALVVVLAAVVAFLWATDRGQFDDLDTPAMRMLHDDREASAAAAVSRTPRAPSTARRPPAPR